MWPASSTSSSVAWSSPSSSASLSSDVSEIEMERLEAKWIVSIWVLSSVGTSIEFRNFLHSVVSFKHSQFDFRNLDCS